MKINYRQLSVMIFMSFIALKFLILPSVLFQKSGNMSWLVALCLMLIDGVYVLMIINLMKKNQNININEFMISVVGKFFTKVFLLVLSVDFFLKVALLVKGMEFFVVENFYNNFSWLLYILPLIAVVGFMIYKGLRNVARVQEIFYLSIIVGCIYIACKSLGDVDPLVYLPMFKDGIMPLLDSAYTHLCWFGSGTFALMLFGKVDFSNSKKGIAIKYVIFAILLVQLIFFVFYALFDITSPTHTFAISDISQYSSTKSIIDELSWLVVSLWVVVQVIQTAVYGYCLMLSIMYLFKIKSKIPVIIFIDIFILSLGYIGSATINLEQIFFSDFASISLMLAQYLIPLVLFIAYSVRKKLKRKEVKHEKVKINV